MDGTLIDSANYHWITWRDSLAELGFALTPEIFRSWFGSRNDRILRQMFPDMPDDEVKRVGDLKEARYRALVRKDGIELLPGVRMWLERLHEAGWRQAVASSAPPANIDVLIDVLELGDILQAAVSAEEVPHGKPAPDVFLRAAAKLGVDPHDRWWSRMPPSAWRPAAAAACALSGSPVRTGPSRPMSSSPR